MVRLSISRIRLSDVLKGVIFPITAFEFFDALKKRGYKILVSPPPFSPTPSAYVSGSVAEKNGCTIFINPDRKFFGVEGNSIERIERIYLELTDIIRERFEVNLEEERIYTELISDGIVRSRRMPMNRLAEVFKGSDIIKKASGILGEDVSMFSVRFVPKGRPPRSDEWFDIVIEPSISIPSREYVYRVVYRSPNHEKVYNFFKNFNANISDLIKIVESVGT